MKNKNYKLQLQKETSGYYTTKSGPIEIVISNPYLIMGEGSKEWQTTVTVDDEEIINTWTRTKKQGTQVVIDWLTQ